MNIRRIVPIIGHTLTHRHMPAEGYLKTVAPIAEIGEGNNRFLGHAGEVAQDGFHVLHGLDGLAEHNHIEAAVAEIGAAGMADMGKVMGLLKTRLAGKADMGEVNKILKAVLTA